MDLWVVAAATGAGYLAKYWQAIHGDKKDASSDHNPHQFNEADKSQGISRICDHQIRPSNIFGLENLPQRKCVWDDDQMNVITENESLNSSGTGSIIDDLFLATKSFHPDIISLTSRNPIKPISTMPPTRRPVLVTDGHRITSVGRNHEKEKPHRKQTSSAAAAEAASGFVLLFIGITIGVMTAEKACKGEMDYLGKQLKDSDNLVQDLMDELDMKDTITVNELGDHQFMSEIETELEAELVRLDIINIREPTAGSEQMHEHDDFYSEEDDEDYDTRTANYAVSPKELKLRLYEVLESRLEARIKELEEALEISQPQ